MKITSETKIGETPATEPKFPGHFKSKLTGMIVLLFNSNTGIVLDPGTNSTRKNNDFVRDFNFLGFENRWDRISAESTITISTVA